MLHKCQADCGRRKEDLTGQRHELVSALHYVDNLLHTIFTLPLPPQHATTRLPPR